MMNSKFRNKLSAILALGLGLSVVSVSALAYTGEEFAKDASITITQAREIALKAYPGEVVDQELESENGGSGLRYSFDIKHGKITHEVGVDAKTSEVLENVEEGPNPD